MTHPYFQVMCNDPPLVNLSRLPSSPLKFITNLLYSRVLCINLSEYDANTNYGIL